MSRKFLTKKSQVLVLDLVLAISAFLIVLLFFFWSWTQTSSKIIDYEINSELNVLGKFAVSSLIDSSGSPQNWDQVSDTNFTVSRIKSLGLLGMEGGFLSVNKINRLKALNNTNYDELKTILGILGPGYNFGIKIYEYNLSNLYVENSSLAIGMFPTNEIEDVFVYQRNYIMNDLNKTKGMMKFYVWKDS